MDLGLQGRSAIVLGASQGMGLAIAEALDGRRRERRDVRAPRRRRRARGGADRRARRRRRPDRGRRSRAPRRDDRRGVRRHRHPRPQRRRPASRRRGRRRRCRRRSRPVELLLVPHVRLVGLCLPHLRASGRGRIIAIESTSVKEPIANLALSNAVRPGRRRLAEDARAGDRPGRHHGQHDRARPDRHRAAPRALRRRRPLRRGRSTRIPARRVGTPAEIAATVCFLASSQAAYVSGHGRAGRRRPPERALLE